jgi:filamentous hemagglutinin family protein
MQGTQHCHSQVNLKSESVWFKAKLISQFFALSFLLTQPFYLSYLHAAPVGDDVVGGAGSISQSDLTTTINQASQNIAINWDSFNVNTNEQVNFVQPNSSSISLNRIIGNNGSTIQGQINANGQVFLVNPHGILFTSSARINVGGLVASSLDMTPDDFMNGNYIFNEVLGVDGNEILTEID